MAATLPSKGRKQRRSISDINMVPFIDVMLVLLIIFMVTAPLLVPSVIDVPSIGKASNAPDQVITIEIDKNLHIAVKSKTASQDGKSQIAQMASMETVAKIVMQLQAGKADTPVIISADKGIVYDEVVKLMDKLQRAGVARVGLAVHQTD
jgi:biopolymer transport protein TolR